MLVILGILMLVRQFKEVASDGPSILVGRPLEQTDYLITQLLRGLDGFDIWKVSILRDKNG